jgi:D-alanine-D-alanine ligase
MSMARRYKIAVLMGGVSDERTVSLKSGKAVAGALAERGHQVAPVDVTERSVDMLDAIRPEAVFIALHGEFGEDGQVQSLLEQKKIPYTGSRPEASRTGMDKVATKRSFIKHSVPTPDYMVVQREEDVRRIAALSERLRYPLVCKPSCGGSSIGVSIVRSERQFILALQQASCSHILLERYVVGRELTMGVLDGEPLPITEVVPKQDFFDYHSKYTDEGTVYITPAPLLESVYARAQEVALRAYEAIGCRHLARVDLIHGNDGQLYVLEVNTIPGFTSRSLVPMAAAHVGLEFGELCEGIVEMALRDAAVRDIREAPVRERRRHIA